MLDIGETSPLPHSLSKPLVSSLQGRVAPAHVRHYDALEHAHSGSSAWPACFVPEKAVPWHLLLLKVMTPKISTERYRSPEWHFLRVHLGNKSQQHKHRWLALPLKAFVGDAVSRAAVTVPPPRPRCRGALSPVNNASSRGRSAATLRRAVYVEQLECLFLWCWADARERTVDVGHSFLKSGQHPLDHPARRCTLASVTPIMVIVALSWGTAAAREHCRHYHQLYPGEAAALLRKRNVTVDNHEQCSLWHQLNLILSKLSNSHY